MLHAHYKGTKEEEEVVVVIAAAAATVTQQKKPRAQINVYVKFLLSAWK